jgi:hypothetical protein
MELTMHPLAVNITTQDPTTGKQIQHQYLTETRHLRWELIKIFLHAFTHLRSA